MGKYDKRARATGRKSKEPPFAMLPNPLLDSSVYVRLSDKAKILLVEVLRQYNGKNNGDMDITLTNMRKRGWNSNDKLTKAKNELIEAGLLVQTRQGGRHKCSLYAITWKPIDDCEGKLDVKPAVTPILSLSRLEKAEMPVLKSGKIKSRVPPHGSIAA